MRQVLVVCAVVLLLASVGWTAEKMAPKGKEVTMSGMMSCTFCTMGTGKMCTSKECCKECIKAGDPVTFHGPKDELYILVSGEQGKPFMTPERMELIGAKVKIKGIIVKRGGLQAIYVKSLEKAE